MTEPLTLINSQDIPLNYLTLCLSLLVGMFTTYICIDLLKPVAIHIGLVDTPGGRKRHDNAIPLIGGMAIFLGFSFALLCLDISLKTYRGLLAGSGILVLLGVMDDFRELTPRIRLIGQCIVALLLIAWGHLTINHLGNLFFVGNITLGSWSVLITMLFVLGFINAINMIDGHDGLAGLIIAGQALLLAIMSFVLHQHMNFYLLILLTGVLSIFLVFNLPLLSDRVATIFLGDAGSTFIGFVIIWFAVSVSEASMADQTVCLNPMNVLWVLAYPLFDLVSVIYYRLRVGKSPFLGGRDHLHYLLLDSGMSRASVTYLLFGFSFVLGLIGILLSHLGIVEAWQLVSFLVILLSYFFVIARLAR